METTQNKPAINILEILARIGIFGTFIGHGMFAVAVNPKWIHLMTAFGFSNEQAIFIMPYIGFLDIIVAIMILVKPNKWVVFWAIFWTFLTALSRPIAGESILDFFERSANWILPLLLLLIKYYPNTINKLKN